MNFLKILLSNKSFKIIRKVTLLIGIYGVTFTAYHELHADMSTIKKNINTVDYKTKPEAFYEKNLPKDVFYICRKKGTERAFSGKYDDFKDKGTYYCACCGGDYSLFSSSKKYDSKTGWPSFWEPINPSHITLVAETNLISRFLGARTEVKCGRCGSHLGHVFDDGPPPTGKRYCMNSLALSFTAEGKKPVRTFPEN